MVPTAGGELRHLTRDAFHNEPAWSPRGDQIAFVDKTAGGLWVLDDALGDAKPREVLAGPIEINHGCWSPDGKWVAFRRKQNLGIVNVSTGEERLLVEAEDLKGVVSVRWSPDGSTLAGIRSREVVLVDAKSGETETVAGVQGHMVTWGLEGALWIKAALAPQVLLRRAKDGAIEEFNLGGRIRSLDSDPASGRGVVAVDGRGIAVLSHNGEEIVWITDGGTDRAASLAPGGCMAAVVRLGKGGGAGARLLVLDRHTLKDGGFACD